MVNVIAILAILLLIWVVLKIARVAIRLAVFFILLLLVAGLVYFVFMR